MSTSERRAPAPRLTSSGSWHHGPCARRDNGPPAQRNRCMKRKNVRRLSRAVFDGSGAAEVLLQVIATRGFTRRACSAAAPRASRARSPSSSARSAPAARAHDAAREPDGGQPALRLPPSACSKARRSARDAVTELTGGIPRGRLRDDAGLRRRAARRPLDPELRRRYPQLVVETDLSDQQPAARLGRLRPHRSAWGASTTRPRVRGLGASP